MIMSAASWHRTRGSQTPHQSILSRLKARSHSPRSRSGSYSKGDEGTQEISISWLTNIRSLPYPARRAFVRALEGDAVSPYASRPNSSVEHWIFCEKARTNVLRIDGSQRIHGTMDVAAQTDEKVHAVGQELAVRFVSVVAYVILEEFDINGRRRIHDRVLRVEYISFITAYLRCLGPVIH